MVEKNLTAQEVAEYLRCSLDTLYGYLQKGEFPKSYNRQGKGWIIKLSDVLAYEERKNRETIESGQMCVPDHKSSKSSTRLQKGFVRRW